MLSTGKRNSLLMPVLWPVTDLGRLSLGRAKEHWSGALQKRQWTEVKENEVGVCVGKLEEKDSRGRCNQLGLLPVIGRRPDLNDGSQRAEGRC